jgi:hypothetical protein
VRWLKGFGRAALRRREDDWTFALVAGGLFAVAVIVGHSFHEMWRDELHCFAIGRNAYGLWDVLTGERRYDGHPFLWYYVLHLASRITRHYAVTHVVAGSLIIAAGLLWLRFATVPRVVRVLLLPTYLFLYEYGVMCRAYTLGLFLVFVFCAVYHPARPRYVALGALLAVLAPANFFATLVSMALALFLFSHGPTLEPREAVTGRRRLSVPSGWFIGLAIYGAGLAVTALTTWPPSDALYRPGDVANTTLETVKTSFTYYGFGMFPTRWYLDWIWTGFDRLAQRIDAVATPKVQLTMGAVWFAAWLIALRRSPRILLCYVVGCVLLACGFHFVYVGGPRHLGHFFILTLAFLWLYRRETRERGRDRLAVALLTVNFIVQGAVGILAFRAEIKAPFSGSLEAAKFIRAHHLADRPVVADPDEPSTPVAVILDRPFYFPTTGDTTDVTVFHNRRRGISQDELLAAAERLARADRGKALILTSYDLSERRAGVDVTLLHRTRALFATDEAVRIYDVRVK